MDEDDRLTVPPMPVRLIVQICRLPLEMSQERGRARLRWPGATL